MKEFSDKQNEAFSGIFDALASMGASFTVQAHTIIDLDDANFKKVFTANSSRLIGSDADVKKVRDRAYKLGIA